MARKSRKRFFRPHAAHSGFIVVSDIKNFSTTPNDEQTRVVRNMWSALRKQKLFKRAGAVVCNGTGDGVIVALPSTTVSVNHRQVMEFAAGWNKDAHNRVEMRLAVHQGAFRVVDVKGHGHPHLIGRAVNEAARMVNFAEPDLIAVSDYFWREWAGSDDASRQPHLERVSEPATVWVKHDRAETIRIYDVTGKMTSAPAPRKLREIQEVTTKITAMLEEIHRGFIDLLERSKPGAVDTAKVALRASILAPRRETNGAPVLRHTDFRVWANRGTPRKKSVETTYATTGSGLGPPGRAFAGQTIEVLHQLPDPEVDGSGYFARLEEADVSRGTVENFSYLSRALMQIPFGLLPNESDGVICLDSMDPLENFTKEDVVSICTTLQENHALPLALLWRARIQ